MSASESESSRLIEGPVPPAATVTVTSSIDTAPEGVAAAAPCAVPDGVAASVAQHADISRGSFEDGYLST